MRDLRTLMLILLAAVFAAGGPLRASPAHAGAVPACHAVASETHDKSPAHKSKPGVMTLNCCAGCLPTTARDVPTSLAPRAAVGIAFTPLRQTADGLSPAPEHGPPRPFA